MKDIGKILAIAVFFAAVFLGGCVHREEIASNTSAFQPPPKVNHQKPQAPGDGNCGSLKPPPNITPIADLIYRRRWAEAAESLKTATYLDSLDREFLRGYVNMKLGNFAAAESIFAGLFTADYDLNDWVNLYLAKAAYENGDYPLAHQLAKTLGKMPGYEGDIARLRWRSLWEGGQKNRALAELDTLRKIGLISKWNYKYFRGYCLAQMGRKKEAKKIFRDIIKSLRGKRKYCWYVEHACEQLGELGHLSQDDIKLIGEGYYRCREYAEALKWLKKVKNPSKNGRLYYYRAVAELKQEMYSAAITDLKKIIRKQWYSPGYAWWRLGYCYRKLGKLDKALAAQDSALRYAPDALVETQAWKEKIFIARQKNDWGLLTYSAVNLVETAGGSSDAAIGLLWAGFGYHQLGKPDSAAAFLRKHFHDFKDDDFKDEILYWMAKFYLEGGDSGLADTLFRNLAASKRENLFVWLARERLTGQTPPPVDKYIPVEPLPIDSLYALGRAALGEQFRKQLVSLPKNGFFTRAEHLARLGLLDVARVAYTDLINSGQIGKNAAEKLELWRYFYGLRMYSLATKMGLSFLSDIGSRRTELYQIAYPMPFYTFVNAYSKKYDVNPLFVYAVMQQESFFDPYARSYADARGLMQFIPSTAEEVARKLGISDFDEENLYDYQTSIQMGIYLLDELLTRWKEPVYALSEYNAGGTPTRRWEEFCPVDDDAIYCTELFDYKQTRLYVKKILAKYRNYCLAYGLLNG